MGSENKLFLSFPCEADFAELAEYIAEHNAVGEAELHGGALLGSMALGDWLALCRKNADIATVSPDWVYSEVFLARRSGDHRLIGLIDVRYGLNDFLSHYGGNIGFGVRPSERMRGYAGEMLALGLQKAREHGIDRVLLGCYADNAASKGVIIKANGTLIRSGTFTDGQAMEMYEIIF